MDANIKKILETLNNQIDSKELTAALKADSFEGEYALSEDGLKAITDQTSTLLSENAAVHNKTVIETISRELYPKHMKSALTKVEEQLKPIMDKLGIDYSDKEFISDAIAEIEPKLEELGKGDGDNDKTIVSLREDLRKAKESLENKDTEYQQELKKRDEAILTDKIRHTFKSKVTEKPWGEAYLIPGVQESVLDGLWKTVTSKAHLKLDNEGNIVPMDKEDPEKELYNGNKVETFQSLLEPLMEPIIKKSNGPPTSTPPPGGGETLSPEEEKRKREYERQKETYG